MVRQNIPAAKKPLIRLIEINENVSSSLEPRRHSLSPPIDKQHMIID